MTRRITIEDSYSESRNIRINGITRGVLKWQKGQWMVSVWIPISADEFDILNDKVEDIDVNTTREDNIKLNLMDTNPTSSPTMRGGNISGGCIS